MSNFQPKHRQRCGQSSRADGPPACRRPSLAQQHGGESRAPANAVAILPLIILYVGVLFAVVGSAVDQSNHLDFPTTT